MLIVLQEHCKCGFCDGRRNVNTWYSLVVEGKSDKEYEDEGRTVIGRAASDEEARVLIMKADRNSALHTFCDKDGKLLIAGVSKCA